MLPHAGITNESRVKAPHKVSFGNMRLDFTRPDPFYYYNWNILCQGYYSFVIAPSNSKHQIYVAQHSRYVGLKAYPAAKFSF